MATITLILTVEFDEVLDVEMEAEILRKAIQNRIFGTETFSPETLVELWHIRIVTET